MKATIKIIGANTYTQGLIERTFVNVVIGRNNDGSIVFLTNDAVVKEIFLDRNSSIHFTEHGFVVEGYGIVGYNVGKLSILIQSYETNALL
jgi:hypothetical protein